MNSSAATHKSQFKIHLNPIIDLLNYKKTVMQFEQWLAFLARTESRIIQSPEQFLGHDLPHPTVIEQIVKEIFAEVFEKESAVA